MHQRPFFVSLWYSATGLTGPRDLGFGLADRWTTVRGLLG